MIDSAAPDIAIEFQLSSDFKEILPGASPSEARAAVVDRYGPEVVATLPPALLDEAVSQFEAISELLRQAGIFHASVCLGRVGERVTLSSLTFGRMEADCTDPAVAVAGILRIKGRGQGSDRRDIKRFDLPCGPAAVVIETAVGLLLPAGELGTAKDLPLPVATLQAYIPVPKEADRSRRSMVVVTFSTPSIQHWEAYCPVLVDLLRSLRFPTGAQGAIASVDTKAEPLVAVSTRSRISDALG